MNESIWLKDERKINRLKGLVRLLVLIHLGILLIQLIIPQLRNGLAVSFMPLILYTLPFLGFISPVKTNVDYRLLGIYFVSMTHLIIFIFLIFICILVSLFSSGALFAIGFGLAVIFGSILFNIGLGAFYLIEGIIWTLVVPFLLFPLINNQNKNFTSKFQHPISALKPIGKLIFISALPLYAFICVVVYTFCVVWLVPTTSSFWDSWIF